EDEALGVRPSRLVVGGVVPGAPTVHLGTHVPESRSARRGAVRVSEPDVPGATGALGADELRLCDGFLIGRLQELDIARRGALGTDERGIVQEILGVAPPVDFLSGLNQVLVLGRARPGDPPSVPLRASVPAQAGVWRSASVLGVGDACPWRDTLRIGAGARSGVARGAAVVDGARLLGRVTRADAAGATVARLSDPGTEIVLLASHAAAPDAVPLVLGRLVARGAGGGGELLLEWSPTPVELDRARAWAARLGHGGDFLDVRLFTGSGMRLVPRGLLVGRTRLPVHVRRTEEQGPGAEGEPALNAPSEPALDAPSEPALDAASEPTLDADVQPGFDVRLLRVGGTASARGALRVWLGPGKAAGADA
ncbi:MAG: rod shape-determining protein MreC, partial [Planctomycetota bacterium]